MKFSGEQKINIVLKALLNRQEVKLGEYTYRYFFAGDDFVRRGELLEFTEDALMTKAVMYSGVDKNLGIMGTHVDAKGGETTWLGSEVTLVQFLKLCREADEDMVSVLAANNGLNEVKRQGVLQGIRQER